jgi:hypothetical protein
LLRCGIHLDGRPIAGQVNRRAPTGHAKHECSSKKSATRGYATAPGMKALSIEQQTCVQDVDLDISIEVRRLRNP